jgi:hypothetical protein
VASYTSNIKTLYRVLLRMRAAVFFFDYVKTLYWVLLGQDTIQRVRTLCTTHYILGQDTVLCQDTIQSTFGSGHHTEGQDTTHYILGQDTILCQDTIQSTFRNVCRRCRFRTLLRCRSWIWCSTPPAPPTHPPTHTHTWIDLHQLTHSLICVCVCVCVFTLRRSGTNI